jgi:membrane-associated protease RseP (regulator of RpoE activity)
MHAIRGVGMRRLANPFTVAAMVLALHAAAAFAQSATTRVIVTGKPDTTFVKGDSSRGAIFERHAVIDIRKVDSLLKQQESMPIGSVEYSRIQRELETMIVDVLPRETRVVGPDGEVTILVAPNGMRMPRPAAFTVPKAVADVTPRGWLGFTAEGFQQGWTESDGLYVRHFEYPTVVEVDPDSPASKVGVKFGDVLLGYDGVDLRANAINLTRLLAPGRSVTVKLRRDGEQKDLSLVVEKAPPALLAERRADQVGRMLVPTRAPMPDTVTIERRAVEGQLRRATGGAKAGRTGMVSATRAPSPIAMMMPTGYLGARMSDLDPAGVVALTQQKATSGVLVNAVPLGTPAARIGLRAGDLIVRIGDVPVVSMAQLRHELIAHGDGPVEFSVLREGKIEKLTYDPR